MSADSAKPTASRAAKLLVLALATSACTLLPAPPPVLQQQFGPPYIPSEQHVRTFEALWAHLETDYIYFHDVDVDWEERHQQFLDRAGAADSEADFARTILDLQEVLPSGAMSWQSRAERIQSDLEGSTTHAGIGAFVAFGDRPRPKIIILSVMENSPAQRAGLSAHDSIVTIDGVDVGREEGVRAVERIQGAPGSQVRLVVQTPGRPDRALAVRREPISGEVALQFGTVTGTDVGYLLFPAIGYEGLADDVLSGLKELTTNRRLGGLILDLRVSGSMQGWPLQELLTIFGNGILGEFYDRGRHELVRVNGQDVLSSQTVPLAILVGEHTSGFPEIFAAGLQASGRAVLVGGHTAAAVETSSTFYLPDGSRMIIQSASFRLLSGEEVGPTGVMPDLVIEGAWDQITTTDDPVIDAAVPALISP